MDAGPRPIIARRGRLALRLAVAGLALWPVSYAWVPAGPDPPAYVPALVVVGEAGALVLGVLAAVLGWRVRAGVAFWLGMVVIGLVVGGNLLAIWLLN